MSEGIPKPQEPREEEIFEGRRKFLIGAGSAGVAGALGVAAYELTQSKRKSAEHKVPEFGDRPPEPVHRGAFPTGEIEGRKVSDLFAFYLGVPEQQKIPENIDPDFGTIMYDLWQKKLARVHRTHPERMNNVQKAEHHFGRQYIDAWKEGKITKGSLSELVKDADEVIAETRDGFEWSRFHESHRYGHLFGPEETDLVHRLSQNITPEMLVAYSITELMPYEGDSDPLLRKMPLDVYELLLAHAGREFLVDVPAVNDVQVSAGMFQFTSYALYEDGKETRGASRLNKLIRDPKNRLPGSVMQLDTAEKQIRAAYLFSLDNLAHLVQHIANDRTHGRDKKRIRTLIENENTLHAGLLQYIASAHHNPAEAITAFTKWIDEDFRGSHADLCGPRIQTYVRSAFVNYEELKKKL